MSLTQIESELQRLSAEELRQLAMTSWRAYLQREQCEPAVNECDELDPELLAALDEAVRRADAPGSRRYSVDEVRSRLRSWITK
jgi:hypothetical protein